MLESLILDSDDKLKQMWTGTKLFVSNQEQFLMCTSSCGVSPQADSEASFQAKEGEERCHRRKTAQLQDQDQLHF